MASMDPVLTSAGYLLLKAGHQVGLAVEEAMAALGLSARELLVLSFVGASDDLSQQALSERLGIDPTIVVGLVDDLEARGLVTRTRDPADRRRNVLAVTAEGRALHRRAVDAAVGVEDAFLGPLSASQREQLRRSLLAVMRPRLHWLGQA